MSDEQFDAALDLLRRLKPQNVSHNVDQIISLVPDLQDALLESVDQPLQVKKCPDTSREYLVCDYNRDGDAHRSPWSNKYNPPNTEGNVPSEALRKLEVTANEAFDTYRHLYYEGGISSVYLWEQQDDVDDGIAGVVLLKKNSTMSGGGKGGWDSVHVFEATNQARKATYKLTSTIMLYMGASSDDVKDMNLSGNLTRQSQTTLPLDAPVSHVYNIGRLVEDMEIKMRNLLQEVYFTKTKDIVNDLRSMEKVSDRETSRLQQQEMMSTIGK